MTFLHPFLLGGLLLVGVPILLHLIMRQKPKQLAFPAFRFLRQKLHVNRRKLRLQNLLLLLLRMLLILLLCLALARPSVQTGKIRFLPDQEVSAVFVFDTSPSMEYTVGNLTRLDEARQRARELLNDMAVGSRVAVLDSAEEPGGDDRAQEWLPLAQARTRVDNLRIRAGNWPLNRQIEHACDLLAKLGSTADAGPRFLYVFSDRTTASWDDKAAAKLQVPEGVGTVYVDVGVDNPRDLSVDDVTIYPAIAAPGQTVYVQATVHATGEGAGETELQCQFEGEVNPDRQVIKPLKKDERQTYVFEKTAPPLASGETQATYQVTVRLGTNDNLPANNARYATFATRNRRTVLTLVQDKGDRDKARVWAKALDNAPGLFEADVRTIEDAAKIDRKDLKAYKIVCLFETTSFPGWLTEYVRTGGGLVIVPAGQLSDADRDAYNAAGAKLLPAPWKKLVKRSEDGAPWAGYLNHPITAPLDKWSKTVDPDFKHPDYLPKANGYWAVDVTDEKMVLAKYADGDEKEKAHAALLERPVDQGRVIQFTTPLDGGEMERNRNWNNYWTDSSFGFVLVDLVCRYLAGEGSGVDVNHLCRQRFTVPLPGAPFEPPFKLFGPGLSESESTLALSADQASLDVPPTLEAGNFFIRGSSKDERNAAAFSMNIRPEEYDLTRVPVDDIEKVFGPDSVLAVERTGSFSDELTKRWSQARELLPYLMLFLLLMMPVESVLANLFSRRQAAQPGERKSD